MNDKSFHFWQRWLTWANVIPLLVGLLVAFAGNSIFFELHNSYTTDLYFQHHPLTGDLLRFKNWMFGIIGGSIVAFHWLMIAISENAFKRRERWAYRAMWGSLLGWFIIDSGISLFYEATHNVVLINLPALVLIGLPLVMTRHHFGTINT